MPKSRTSLLPEIRRVLKDLYKSNHKVNDYLCEKFLYTHVANVGATWIIIKDVQNILGTRTLSEIELFEIIDFRYKRKVSIPTKKKHTEALIDGGFLSVVYPHGIKRYFITARPDIENKYIPVIKHTGSKPINAAPRPVKEMLGGFHDINAIFTKYAAERGSTYLRGQRLIAKQTGVRRQATTSNRLSKAGASKNKNAKELAATDLYPISETWKARKELKEILNGIYIDGQEDPRRVYFEQRKTNQGSTFFVVLLRLPDSYNSTASGKTRRMRAWERAAQRKLQMGETPAKERTFDKAAKNKLYAERMRAKENRTPEPIDNKLTLTGKFLISPPYVKIKRWCLSFGAHPEPNPEQKEMGNPCVLPRTLATENYVAFPMVHASSISHY